MREQSEVEVRLIEATDSISELTALLHLAYARLAAMGLRFMATHQSDDITLERTKQGECYVGIKDGRIVATITIVPPENTGGSPWYDQPHVGYFTQFAVHPDLQKSGVGSRLMRLAEDRALAMGATELALDTSEQALHLIDYYTRAGYRFVEHVRWGEVNYRSVVLSKNLSSQPDRA